MRSALFVLLTLAMATVSIVATPEAGAQTRSAVKKTAEGSMVLTGQIDIGTEGQVEGFTLDGQDKVPADLAAFVDRSVRRWRFEPVVRDGKPVHARTFVSLRLIAKADADGHDMVKVQSANFEKYDPRATDSVTSLSMAPPRYPLRAAEMNGSGEVVLMLQVGRDGKVMDVVAEQVNLRVLGDEPQMKQLRELFAKESISAARRWTFRPPATGAHVDAPNWTVRVPVDFALNDRSTAYGRWNVYIPGPRTRAGWRGEAVQSPADTGPLPAGGVYMADSSNGPHLLTPPGG